MSGLENLQTRIQYRGGKQEGRMIKDKEKALKKALLYSYQACTAILADGREFRCLINPDKLKTNYDDKIISIPFKDICVGRNNLAADSEQPVTSGTKPQGKTSEGEEEIGMKAGDVFKWKETNSDWLVYLQRIEEDAYFRAEIRRCRHEVKINDTIYKVYAAAIDRDEISWITKQNISFNELNYGLNMFITKNQETENQNCKNNTHKRLKYSFYHGHTDGQAGQIPKFAPNQGLQYTQLRSQHPQSGHKYRKNRFYSANTAQPQPHLHRSSPHRHCRPAWHIP